MSLQPLDPTLQHRRRRIPWNTQSRRMKSLHPMGSPLTTAPPSTNLQSSDPRVHPRNNTASVGCVSGVLVGGSKPYMPERPTRKARSATGAFVGSVGGSLSNKASARGRAGVMQRRRACAVWGVTCHTHAQHPNLPENLPTDDQHTCTHDTNTYMHTSKHIHPAEPMQKCRNTHRSPFDLTVGHFHNKCWLYMEDQLCPYG